VRGEIMKFAGREIMEFSGKEIMKFVRGEIMKFGGRNKDTVFFREE
jgi:hypothetical protein